MADRPAQASQREFLWHWRNECSCGFSRDSSVGPWHYAVDAAADQLLTLEDHP